MSNDETGVPLYHGDIAPGDERADGTEVAEGIRGYLIGLGLSVLATVVAFFLSGTSLVWQPSIPAALIVLAIAQMGVHLVFFLHITTGPDSTNNVLALALGILIVILVAAGSIFIMANLNEAMMPPLELMNPHMQH